MKWLSVFKGVYDGKFSFNDEVTDIKPFSFEEIKEMIDAGEKMHPELIFILEKEYGFRTIYKAFIYYEAVVI